MNHITTCENQDHIEPNWWKEVVVYQIYPRSFLDSNGDGIGDLRGIISRLDYVKNLGVDAIWLNPIFKSPNDDMGYDISDYCDIMSEFGTMADFDELLTAVHDRGMKLILDLVVNHTSDEHPWFVEAKKSRENPYYNYYHWWPAEKGEPPFRASYFDENGYAWKYNPPTDSYYLHYFSRKQPDLNWDNPKVREEIYSVIRFWFDKGIDGFRMDSIPLIGKDPTHPIIDTEQHPYMFDFYAQSPAMHGYLREMNLRILSHYDILTVGEGSAVKVDDAWKFVDPSRQELQMLYHFGPSEVRNWTTPDRRNSGLDYSLIAFKKMFDDWDKKIRGGWPVIYLGNHDQPRIVSRFGSDKPEYRGYSAKMLATLLLTLRGTPYLYAGDEIGMSNPRYNSIRDYKDISTINEYKRIRKEGGDLSAFLETQKEVSRDNSRSPFQWTDEANGGFTTGKPWLKLNQDYKKINAWQQESDENSILNYYRKLIEIRKASKTLTYGSFELLLPRHEQIFAYDRALHGDKYHIILNFTEKETTLSTLYDFENQVQIVLTNYNCGLRQDKKGRVLLRPYEALILKDLQD